MGGECSLLHLGSQEEVLRTSPSREPGVGLRFQQFPWPLHQGACLSGAAPTHSTSEGKEMPAGPRGSPVPHTPSAATRTAGILSSQEQTAQHPNALPRTTGTKTHPHMLHVHPNTRNFRKYH